jgi:hypothetical protein
MVVGWLLAPDQCFFDALLKSYSLKNRTDCALCYKSSFIQSLILQRVELFLPCVFATGSEDVGVTAAAVVTSFITRIHFFLRETQKNTQS